MALVETMRLEIGMIGAGWKETELVEGSKIAM